MKEAVAKEGSNAETPGQPERQTSVHTVQVQALDDVTFKLNENNDGKRLLEKVTKISDCGHVIHSLHYVVCQAKS